MKLHRLTDKLGDLAGALVGWRPDAMMIVGATAVSYGAWIVYPAAGFITGGLMAMAAGWIESRSAR